MFECDVQFACRSGNAVKHALVRGSSVFIILCKNKQCSLVGGLVEGLLVSKSIGIVLLELERGSEPSYFIAGSDCEQSATYSTVADHVQ